MSQIQGVTPSFTDKFLAQIAQRVETNRADLIARFRQSLQGTLFTNRLEMRPSKLGAIATEEVDALVRALLRPDFGSEHGEKLSQMGLSEQSVLALGQAKRQFMLALFDKDLTPQVLEVIDVYESGIISGYVRGQEKLILAEQERIRGAIQIAIGHFTVEIKDVQEMAQKANEANEFKTRFIARVSHELRTPLGALLGMAEMLQQNVYGPLTPAQLDIIERLINNTHTLERVFTELLDQSQLESGLLRLRQDEFSPKTLVNTIHDNYLPLALKKGLTMQVEFDPALPNPLIGDKERMEQILSNLVLNAVKYTQTGGIKLLVRREGAAQWIIQVKDTGIGISEEDQALIFEPFRQADETTGRKFGGVGLGLAIVRQLATAMGGSVSVESKLGRGSIFSVILPLRTGRESV